MRIGGTVNLVYENAYASVVYHCFSLPSNSSVPPLVGIQSEARLTGINVVSALELMLFLRQRYLGCESSCLASTGSDQPAEVVEDTPRNLIGGTETSSLSSLCVVVWRKMANSKTVLILCGDYMEDYEVMVPYQALQAYGISVDAVCPGKKAGDICPTAVHQLSTHQTYSESRGHNFTLNATFDEIEASKYDGLIIPGGRAPEYLAMNESVLDLLRKFSQFGKPIASICHGQLILVAAGLVKGRRCTAFPAVKHTLVAGGSHWVEAETMSACVADGNLITAATYEGHPEFIRLFVKALGGTIHGSDKRILFLCGDYMEDYEVKVPFQSLQALECHVDAVCPKKKAGDTCPTAIHDFEGDQTYSEKPGHDFTLTETFENLDYSSYDALVIPGGRAPEYLALDENVLALVKDFMKAGKPVASICHGQQILSAADVLKGRKCTAYPAVKLNVVLAGATWLEPDPIDRCFTDGNLVTGAAWPAHPQFVSQLMTLLGIQVSF